MLKFINNNKLLVIIIHIAIGYLGTFPVLPKLISSLFFGIGILIIISTRNRKDEALYLACYVIGSEVFWRMTRGVFLYETGKYGTILLLYLGVFFVGIKQKINPLFYFYILLLLLGIVFTQVPPGESIRNAISFNLSGPITLGLFSIYLYMKPISKTKFFELLFVMLLPIFSMVSYMYFRTPDLKEIVFRGVANFDTSGGFGPNQVATILGLGIFILGSFILLKRKVSGYLLLDILFLIYFIYRGLLTFSRGGILTGGICLLAFAIIIIINQRGSIRLIIKYVLISVVALIGIWLYTSDITGGMLNNRYTGKNASGKSKDITSGRGDTFKMQLESFYEAPFFGIGVGNGKYKRSASDKKVTAASHNEISRLIEEHGSIGVIILIILISIPLAHFYNSNNFNRAFILAFSLFWFLTINHSAMRLAFPGFLYALSLIRIVDEED